MRAPKERFELVHQFLTKVDLGFAGAGQAGELAAVIDRDRRQIEQMMAGLGGKVARPGANKGCS